MLSSELIHTGTLVLRHGHAGTETHKHTCTNTYTHACTNTHKHTCTNARGQTGTEARWGGSRLHGGGLRCLAAP
eukprot:1897747-Rhodomonas_salina.1